MPLPVRIVISFKTIIGWNSYMLVLLLQSLETEEERKIFAEIYYKYEQYLLKTATDKLDDKSFVLDCVQDTFFELIKSFDNFKAVESENKQKSYIATICKRCAIKINNNKNNKSISFETISENDLKQSDDFFLYKADYKRLVETIYDLKDIYREPLIMKYAEEYTINEISEILGVPVNTVKQRLLRGRRMIVDALGQE